MGDVILQKTYARDFLSERRVLNTGQAPQKYVENNHPAIIDRTTWNAVQAEMERRVSLRSVEETGKGQYSGRYAFSGKIECGCCGSGYRRHHAHGAGLWVCKQHIKRAALCPALPIKERVIEAAFVRTLNGIVQNRDEITTIVGDAVNDALAEAGEELDRNDELREVDGQIESLQARVLELNKQRGKGINEVDDVLNEWRSYVAEEKEKAIKTIIETENLKEAETRKFISTAFETGSIKTTGTDVDKILPPISRFGTGNRDEKRKTVLTRLLEFFERFFGIG